MAASNPKICINFNDFIKGVDNSYNRAAAYGEPINYTGDMELKSCIEAFTRCCKNANFVLQPHELYVFYTTISMINNWILDYMDSEKGEYNEY